MKQEIKLSLENKTLGVEITGDSISALDVIGILMNGLVTVAEEIVKQAKENSDEDQIRRGLYDHMVTGFSAAMLAFNPESKDYKKIEE